MDVNFEYYKVFYYVAKYKNFTKAAHALGSGQPNVTRAMNCLEQQTHCTLFIRTNRGVQLTPEGEMLFTHVEAAISQIQTAETELNAHSGLEHGSISIGASETALNIYLLDIRRRHTKLDCDCYAGFIDDGSDDNTCCYTDKSYFLKKADSDDNTRKSDYHRAGSHRNIKVSLLLRENASA